ncbi:MAG: hypothetical protein K5685_10575 [Bacteroidales bacterium]|nr:hypothetical protein [Bacteroidales bacterium]
MKHFFKDVQLTELTEEQMREIDGGNPIAVAAGIALALFLIGGCAKEAY